MKIGELARATGTISETIRYYERIGLLPRPARTDSNYRDYGPADVERLSFIRHARGLGFELADITSLIALADEPDRDCREVDEIASRHLAAVRAKIARLASLEEQLNRVVTRCRGGQTSDCKILGALQEHRTCAGDHRPLSV